MSEIELPVGAGRVCGGDALHEIERRLVARECVRERALVKPNVPNASISGAQVALPGNAVWKSGNQRLQLSSCLFGTLQRLGRVA